MFSAQDSTHKNLKSVVGKELDAKIHAYKSISEETNLSMEIITNLGCIFRKMLCDSLEIIGHDLIGSENSPVELGIKSYHVSNKMVLI